MLKEIRHLRIRDLLDERGELRISAINEALDVSEATIRRDLDELASKGWVLRTHGGAVRADRVAPEPPLQQRASAHSGEKDLLGQAAATMVADGETIFLGTGTTVAAIVPHLASTKDLTIISNSLPVIDLLAERDDVEVVVIGGMFRPSEGSMVGSLADDAIRQFRTDHVFMGIRAIDPVAGLTNRSIVEGTTDRTVLQVSSHRVIMADHSKFGEVSTFKVAPVSEASVILTSQLTKEELAKEIESEGPEILWAEEMIG